MFVPCRCLVHVVRSANVRYSKVRPLHPLCQFDVCRHEVRYGCQREDSCSFAHSVIELKCWVLQQDTGGHSILLYFHMLKDRMEFHGGLNVLIRDHARRNGAGVQKTLAAPGTECPETAEGKGTGRFKELVVRAVFQILVQGLIVKCPGTAEFSAFISVDLSFAITLQPLHIPHPSSSSSIPGGGFGGMGGGGVGGECLGGGGVSPMGVGGLGGASGRGRPLNLKMKFVCGQCWREGQVSEPDKNLKYCTAKARHR